MTNTSKNWVLDRVLALDELCPGLAGNFLRSSRERRQVIASYLAMRSVRSVPQQQEAELLLSGSHESILAAAHGVVPAGLRGCLGRAGDSMHPRRFYLYLAALLGAAGRETRDILAQQPIVDLTRLRVMRILPREIRTPHFVAIHRDVERARHTTSIFRLMIDNGVDPEALGQSLRQVQTPGAMGRCWQRWVEKLNFPDPPVKASQVYRPIRSGGELKATALRFRNCLRRYLTDALDGSDAFAIYSAAEQEVVIHLRSRDGVWVLDGCHARCNRSVRPAARAEAIEFLRDRGVSVWSRPKSKISKWDPLREMIARWEFNHDIEVGWG